TPPNKEEHNDSISFSSFPCSSFFLRNLKNPVLLITVCILFFPQEKAFNDILTNKGPELLKDLDAFLGDNKWFVGKSVTWADFYWDVCSTTLLSYKADLADKYPRLLALRDRVQALPAIAAWIQKRPKTAI
ncbi:hematopoietic prostaglandin D synthase-like, partial [Meleagris gallopavo]